MLFPLATLLAIAPLFALASPIKNTPYVTIPISKRDTTLHFDGSVNIPAVKAQVARATAKVLRGFDAYTSNTGKRHPSQRGPAVASSKRDVATVPLVDVSNEELWSGEISIGTPPKVFVIDADSGSADLFLPASTCGSTCNGHVKYTASASSTSVSIGTRFMLTYGDGSSVSGTQYTDTVTIGGLTATSQTLGAATQYSNGFATINFPPDGLLGMAFQSLSEYNAPPLFQTLMDQGQVENAVFAFKLATTGSELNLGGINPSAYTGNITYTPVTTAAYWQIAFDSLAVNGTEVAGSTFAIVDTGTTLIIGTVDEISAFWSAIPEASDATYTVGSGYWTFPCGTTLPTVTWTISGEFTMSPESLNFGPISKGSSVCLGTLIGNTAIGTNIDFCILGDSFLRNAYTIFDVENEKVGFAKMA